MKSKYNILYLDINNNSTEQLQINATCDIKYMSEGLKKVYSLSKDMCFEIYYFAESSMNKSIKKA